MVHRAARAHARSRNPAITWAREALSDPGTVFLDTETTGFGRSAGIVDLGVVAADGTVLIDTLVNPGIPIPEAASRVHGIFDSDVAGAPFWEEVLPLVEAMLAGRRVVVYNVAFDQPIIDEHCSQCGVVIEVAAWECAMHAYARFRGERHRKYRTYRWHSLTAACAHLGLQPGGHRALADALACREVVIRMAGSDE